MNFSDLLTLLDQYPPWVRYLLGVILVLILVFGLTLIFARLPANPHGETTETSDARAQPPARLSAYKEFLGAKPNAYLVAAGVEGHVYLHTETQATVFSHFLLEAINGRADGDRNGAITWRELTGYLTREIREYGASTLRRGLNPPVVFANAVEDPVFVGNDVPFEDAVGLVIGVGDYDNGRNFSSGGAPIFVSVMRDKLQLVSRQLGTGTATLEAVKRTLQEVTSIVKRDDLLILYFAGFTLLNEEGQAGWMLYSRGRVEAIWAREVAHFLERSSAKYVLVIMDCALDLPR